MVGVEAPGNAAKVETGGEAWRARSRGSCLDALALVALGHGGADEGERHGVERAASILSTSYTSSRGMEFWLAVIPISRALIATRPRANAAW